MNIDFNLSTPAMLFPAISLLMLAYTNRFVVLADLIRNLHDTHSNNPSDVTLAQITNLKYRMQIIKKMQVFGANAFIFSAISMFLSMLEFHLASKIVFTISLLLLIVSLIFLLKELSISIDALTIQLDDIQDEH